MVQLRIALIYLILTIPVAAQIGPGDIPSKVLNQSLRTNLNSEVVMEWVAWLIPEELKEELRGSLKMKRSLPDSLVMGKWKLGEEVGYVLLDRAPSKVETFEYALYLQEDGSIRAVDVLIYRESEGGEIDHPAFRKQFVGKRNPRRIIPGRTIQAISGATISSRSITYSVRDLLTIFLKLRAREGK